MLADDTATLTAWGILRPADVVTIAAEAGLELAAACALLEQESGGGRNVWGSDGVPTGGAYVKGAEVTRDAYWAYRAALAAGRAGQQGVGPTQLTSVGFQDRADAAGGCWDPVANMRVGFALLHTYAKQWGLERAFRAYNGGPGNREPGRNAHADRYALSAMDKYRRWLDRLGPTTPSPRTLLEDDAMASLPLFPDSAGRFHAAVGAEVGAGSRVAAEGWVSVGSTYGGTTFTLAALAADGKVLGYWPNLRVGNNTQVSRQLPAGTRAVTCEGIADNAGTRPWSSVWHVR